MKVNLYFNIQQAGQQLGPAKLSNVLINVEHPNNVNEVADEVFSVIYDHVFIDYVITNNYPGSTEITAKFFVDEEYETENHKVAEIPGVLISTINARPDDIDVAAALWERTNWYHEVIKEN